MSHSTQEYNSDRDSLPCSWCCGVYLDYHGLFHLYGGRVPQECLPAMRPAANRYLAIVSAGILTNGRDDPDACLKQNGLLVKDATEDPELP